MREMARLRTIRRDSIRGNDGRLRAPFRFGLTTRNDPRAVTSWSGFVYAV